MAAPVIDNFDPDRIPQRDGSQNQGEYSDNMDYFAGKFPPVVDQINVSTAFINDAAVATESNAADADDSKTAAAQSAATAVAAAQSAINSPGTNATSVSTITPALGANSFTLAQTGKAFIVGQFVTVADSSNPANRYFNGAITAFNSGTGAITVEARAALNIPGGSGSSWVISLAAPAYGEKFTSPVQDFIDHGSVSGAVLIDLRQGLKHKLTTSGNITLSFTMPSIFTTTTETWSVLDITKGGSHTISFPAGSLWSDGAQPTQNNGSRFEYLCTKAGSANWILSAPRKNIA